MAASMKKLRLLIVDDHPVYLKGLKALLDLSAGIFDSVEIAPDGRTALELIKERPFDTVLLDIVMPGMDGIETARRMKELRQNVVIIMLTTFDTKELIQKALAAGASGYLLKDASVEDIIHAVEHTTEKNVVLSPPVALSLSSSVLSGAEPANPEQLKIDSLSAREQEVLYLIARFKNNAQIAEELGISERTIRNYVSHIYDILNLHSRTKLISWARRNGIA
jgi:DNA-binding NarL/FixJ family response regulator